MALCAYFAVGLYILGNIVDVRCKIASGVLLLIFLILWRKRKKMKGEFWNGFEQLVLEEWKTYFEGVEYDKKAGFSEEEIKKLGMNALLDCYMSDHQLTGIYHGIAFRDATIHIQKRVRHARRTSYETCFLGRMLVIEGMPEDISEVQLFSQIFHYRNESIIAPHRCEIEGFTTGGLWRVYVEKKEDVEKIFLPSVIKKLNLVTGVEILAIRIFEGKMVVQYSVPSGRVEANSFRRRQYGTLTEKVHKDAQELLGILELAELIRETWKTVGTKI